MSTRKALGISVVYLQACILNVALGTDLCVDCGAGIGRVSKRLLLPLFDSVDMEEQNPVFLKKAEQYLVKYVVKVVHAVGRQ